MSITHAYSGVEISPQGQVGSVGLSLTICRFVFSLAERIGGDMYAAFCL